MSKGHDLLSYIRDGRTMTQREKLQLIVQLSIPSILAQISATVMFFIDASMVGNLGAHATAAIGLVESSTWLLGGLASACNMGFSVQVAHFIGANDFEGARRVRLSCGWVRKGTCGLSFDSFSILCYHINGGLKKRDPICQNTTKERFAGYE